MNNKRHNENLLRTINELEDYAFIFLSTDGDIQTWNNGAQKIKGYTSKEILGQNFRIFYTSDDRNSRKPDQLIEIAKKNGKAQDEGWRVRKDGTQFWGSITITSVHDEKGKIVGFGKVTRDLTEKKLAEQVAIINHKNLELEQFNYIASHDLQEPLRTVSNYIQILEEDFLEHLPEEARTHLKTISNATERMRSLVKSLLDFSRLGRNKIIVSVDCNFLLENIKTDLSTLIKNTGAEITHDKLPIINGYDVELRLLFQNLIINAIKFSKKNELPLIEISCTHKSEHYEFHVRDHGIGIEPQYFERIFQIFQKLANENTNESYGIGLANCKKIVEIHGGKLWVESEFGKGSVFKFTISKILA